jgi:hypothetical protein
MLLHVGVCARVSKKEWLSERKKTEGFEYVC